MFNSKLLTTLDVVVIAARAEEREAIKQYFEEKSDREASSLLKRKTQIPVYAFNLPDNDHPIQVGVMECGEMGNVAAAINTAYAIIQHNPSLIIFSGIAGSMDSKKIRIGDIIMPRQIHTRYFQKLKTLDKNYSDLSDHERLEALEVVSGRLFSFSKSVDIPQGGKHLLEQINASELTLNLKNIEIPEEWSRNGILSRRTMVLNEESSFSWDKVLSNSKYVDFLRNTIGSNICTTIDMESYGFLRAIQQLLSTNMYGTHGVIVRSVSDYAQHKELSDADPKWRRLALDNMAIATYYVIRNGFPAVYESSSKRVQ